MNARLRSRMARRTSRSSSERSRASRLSRAVWFRVRYACIGPCHDRSDGLGQVGGHDLIDGHAAVADRLGELVDDRDRLRDQGFVAGAVEDHPAALPR